MGEKNTAAFTNPDARLRPAKPLEVRVMPEGPPEYYVTDRTFPELSTDWNNIQKDAGLDGYDLVVLGDDSAVAGNDIRRRMIGVGIRQLNTMSSEAVVGALGHEAGLVWRSQHPSAAFVGVRVPGLDAKQLIEIEADALGACLTGKEAAIQALQTGGTTMDAKLPVQLRVDALGQFNPSTCPIGSAGRVQTSALTVGKK